MVTSRARAALSATLSRVSTTLAHPGRRVKRRGGAASSHLSAATRETHLRFPLQRLGTLLPRDVDRGAKRGFRLAQVGVRRTGKQFAAQAVQLGVIEAFA